MSRTSPCPPPHGCRHRRASAAVIAAVAVAALAAGGCTGDDEPPEPPASPTAATTAESAPSPTPDPPTGREPVSSGATGAPDDVVDPDGRPPPEPEPAADVRRVDVTLTGEAVTATFTLAGPVPDEVGSLLWSVELRVDGERAYTVSLQQIGAERHAGVVDWTTRESVELTGDAARTDGDQVTLRAGLDVVPRAADGFAWTAQTQLDDAWEDHVPADGEPRQVAP